MRPSRPVWTRLVPAPGADTWVERLAWTGRDRIVCTEFPGRKTVRLQVYCKTDADAGKLVELFGGKVSQVAPHAVAPASKPFWLQVGKKLLVAGTDAKPPARLGKLPRLVIPAGLAFGTGDHATTAMCLRQLSGMHVPQGGRLLDAGTGSGILALAGALWGWKAEGIDNDADAILESRKNAALNPGVPPVRWGVRGVGGKALPKAAYHAITANLFAALHVQHAGWLAHGLHPEGSMILSGILREQEKEVVKAARAAGLKIRKTLRKGKWICLVCRRA
jgi:ribosomal protein L11 methyltransferase